VVENVLSPSMWIRHGPAGALATSPVTRLATVIVPAQRLVVVVALSVVVPDVATMRWTLSPSRTPKNVSSPAGAVSVAPCPLS
jgi:hypothetical protein